MNVRGSVTTDGRERMRVTRQALTQPLVDHGGDRKSDDVEASQERRDQVDNVSLKHGNAQPYLLRRLARDAPEVLERVKSGEIKSARAAAIEAGIIKPVPTVRLVPDPSRAAAHRHRTPLTPPLPPWRSKEHSAMSRWEVG